MSRGVAKARACGGHGWHGDEIAVLLAGAVRNLYEVTRSWRRNESYRKICDNYAGRGAKAREAADNRESKTTVLQSAWWQAFESGMLQTSLFTDWRKEVGIEQVAYREVAEQCAAIAATNFEKQKFLAALDFSKAF